MHGATLMTGRPPDLPCATSGGMLDFPRLYMAQVPRRLVRTGPRGSIIKVFLSVASLSAFVLPATAGVPPGPQSRPALQRLEAPPVDGATSKPEPAKLAARL